MTCTRQADAKSLAALAAAAVVLGAVATSSNPVFIRMSDVAPTASAVHRMVWALPVFVLWASVTGAGSGVSSAPAAPRDRWLLVLCGVLFAADLAALHAAVTLTTAANAILFLNAQPIYVAIGGWLLFGERIGRRFAGAALIAITGAIVLTTTSASLGAGHALGDALGIVAGLCYAGYILAASRLRAVYSSMMINIATCAVGAPLLLVAALVGEQSILPLTGRDWGLMIGLGVVAHALGQGLIVWGLAHLPTAFASISLLVAPASAALLAWLLLGESLTPMQIAGMGLVLAGVQLAWRTRSGGSNLS